MKLNLDCIDAICQYVPIGDIPKVVVSLYPGATNDEIQSVKYQTRYPSIFFKDIMVEIPMLLSMMEISNASLIGMRAFSYFHNIKLRNEHPWEFICSGKHFSYLCFIDHLQSRGVVWNHLKKHYEDDMSRTESLDSGLFSIEGHLYSNSKLVFIKLIWKKHDENLFDIITYFGMTPLQCFITAEGAFDRYGKLHAQKKFRLWKNEKYNTAPEWEPNLFDAMNICQQSSLKPISFETHRNYSPWFRPSDKFRHISDSESLYCKFLDNVSMEEFNDRTSMIKWCESQYESGPCLHLPNENIIYTELRSSYPTLSLPLVDRIIMNVLRVDMGKTAFEIPNPSWYPSHRFHHVLDDMLMDRQVLRY